MAQTPLTVLGNLPLRTNEDGALLLKVSTLGSLEGPLTPMENVQARTDENGYLIVGIAAGVVPDTFILTGTANQVVVTENPASTFTFSLPQSIATSSTPQFAGVGIGVAGAASELRIFDSGGGVPVWTFSQDPSLYKFKMLPGSIVEWLDELALAEISAGLLGLVDPADYSTPLISLSINGPDIAVGSGATRVLIDGSQAAIAFNGNEGILFKYFEADSVKGLQVGGNIWADSLGSPSNPLGSGFFSYQVVTPLVTGPVASELIASSQAGADGGVGAAGNVLHLITGAGGDSTDPLADGGDGGNLEITLGVSGGAGAGGAAGADGNIVINGLPAFSGDITTATLIGKTITVTNGLITGFAV